MKNYAESMRTDMDELVKTIPKAQIGESMLGLISYASVAEYTSDDTVWRIHQWLVPPDPSIDYNRGKKDRLADTGRWHTDSEIYNTWKETPTFSIWLYGIPGSGKSVLSSTVITDLSDHCSSALERACIYSFFLFSDQEKQQADAMLRSLLVQISSQCWKTQQPLHKLYKDHAKGLRGPTNESMMEALHHMIGFFDETFVVIDALDESSARDEVLEIMKGVAEFRDVGCHLWMTSRREHDIEDSMNKLSFVEKISIRTDVVDEDIRAYISDRLQTDRGLARWRNPEIQQEIVNTMMTKAGGM